MEYIKKLSSFKPAQRITIVFITLIQRLLEAIPYKIKKTYEVISYLSSNKIKFHFSVNNWQITFPINNKNYLFELSDNASDLLVFDQIVIHREFEGLLVLLDKYNIELEYLIDAGANIGLSSIFFKAYFPDLRIIALEPKQSTFKRLQHHIQINMLENITLSSIALWSEQASLSSDDSNKTNLDVGFKLIESSDQITESFKAVGVADLYALFDLPVIDYLKIDIEGSESNLFRSDADLSWLEQIKVISIEIHSKDDIIPITEVLYAYSFMVFTLGELTIGIKRNS